METSEDSEQKAPILHSADVEEADDASTGEENDNSNVAMDRRSGEVADYSDPRVHKTALEPVPPPKVPESFDQEYEEKRKSAALASPEDGIVGSTDDQDEGEEEEEEEEEVWAHQQDGHHYENPDKARQSMASSGSKAGYAYVEVEMQSPDPRDSTPEPPDSGADHDHSETEHLHTSDLPEQSVTHVCTPAKQGTCPEKEEEIHDNCCLRCLRCLTRVPCATLCCWVFMILSVCACGGSLIIGAEKTRALLNEDKTFMHLTHWVCIGVMLGMLLMGSLFLIVAVVSSGKTSKSCFNSHNKNICGRVLNVFAVLFMLILQIAWLAATTLLFLPCALFILLHILHRVYKVDCINLKHYAITSEDKEYCGNDLTRFFLRSDEAFICYAVAYCSAFLATLSMTFFIITASSNFTFLRESRHVSYEVYRNDIRRGSHDSVNMTDTKM